MKVGDIFHLPENYLSASVVYIYGLFDPIDERIRYVGKCRHPLMRLHGHFTAGLKVLNREIGCGMLVERWVGSVIESGRIPQLVILDIGDKENCDTLETQWIEQKHTEGFDLMNNDPLTRKFRGQKGFRRKPSASDNDGGSTLKQFREGRGLSQKELSEMLGVHYSTVSYWESGKRQVPESALLLLEAFDRPSE